MEPLAQLQAELAALRSAGLFREPEEPELAEKIDVCSNDYLGYARQGVSRETLLSAAHVGGAGASRLIYGTRPTHRELERGLADWVSLPDALLFSSGYAANVGLLACLGGPQDVIVSDALNHASIIDGCRLSRSRICVVPHLDTQAVEAALSGASAARRRWVVTETYFSMDGDSPDLTTLSDLCSRYEAGLLLDEAHALGVFGPQGSGLARRAGITPTALVGTLGKALGLAGAFIGGSTTLRAWLWNRARSFVFSTATSPLIASLAQHSLRQARQDDARRAHLLHLADVLRRHLRDAGLDVPRASYGPIVPVLLGAERAVFAAAQLASEGFLARAIRPPTVPRGTARLRLTVKAFLDLRDIERLATCTVRACTGPEPQAS